MANIAIIFPRSVSRMIIWYLAYAHTLFLKDSLNYHVSSVFEYPSSQPCIRIIFRRVRNEYLACASPSPSPMNWPTPDGIRLQTSRVLVVVVYSEASNLHRLPLMVRGRTWKRIYTYSYVGIMYLNDTMVLWYAKRISKWSHLRRFWLMKCICIFIFGNNNRTTLYSMDKKWRLWLSGFRTRNNSRHRSTKYL